MRAVTAGAELGIIRTRGTTRVAAPKRWQQSFSFGGRLPWAIGLLMSLIAVLSLFAAFGSRHVAPLFEVVSLVPPAVWHGQLWRLVTWTFFELSPFGLIMACLMLYWFGRDLAAEWGSNRFLRVFGAVIVVAAAGTCLIGLVDPEVRGHSYVGTWTLTTAMVVTWGLCYPNRVIRVYFVLPIRGYWVAWGTVALTVVYAIYAGWAQFLPELIADASVLAWLYRGTIRRWARSHGLSGGTGGRPRGGGSPKGAQRRGVVVEYLRPVDDDPDSRKREPN